MIYANQQLTSYGMQEIASAIAGSLERSARGVSADGSRVTSRPGAPITQRF